MLSYRAFYKKSIHVVELASLKLSPSISGFLHCSASCYKQQITVIALYIGLSTTRFCVSCIYLSYILSHFLSSVNIFRQKVGRSLFPKSLKSLYLSHFFNFPILRVRPTDFFTYPSHHRIPLLCLLQYHLQGHFLIPPPHLYVPYLYQQFLLWIQPLFFLFLDLLQILLLQLALY